MLRWLRHLIIFELVDSSPTLQSIICVVLGNWKTVIGPVDFLGCPHLVALVTLDDPFLEISDMFLVSYLQSKRPGSCSKIAY